jgi:myosin heavy subunit
LALLDEQCVLMSRSSDKGFASQLYEFHAKSKKHPNFRAGAAEMRGSLFIINHYAGEVCYDTEGFLEKNVDKINPLVLDLLLTSTSKLVTTIATSASLASNVSSASTPSTGAGAVSPSSSLAAGGNSRRASTKPSSSRALSVHC